MSRWRNSCPSAKGLCDNRKRRFLQALEKGWQFASITFTICHITVPVETWVGWNLMQSLNMLWAELIKLWPLEVKAWLEMWYGVTQGALCAPCILPLRACGRLQQPLVVLNTCVLQPGDILYLLNYKRILDGNSGLTFISAKPVFYHGWRALF